MTTDPALAVVQLPRHGIALADVEKLAITEALRLCAWVQKDAAAFLGISPRVINYKIQSLGIELPANHPDVRRYAWRRKEA